MRANDAPTFTETARRTQIVTAAIETIAELGFHRASFAQIARRAGLKSTGLISYHFAGRDELIGQVVVTVYERIGGAMATRVGTAGSPTEMLAAYISGVVEFIGSHRTEMKALLEIFLSWRGGTSYGPEEERSTTGHLEAILRAGQEAGEFRQFDVGVMAMTVQRAVDGLPFALETRPDLDLDLCARELVTLFHKAVVA
jgi:AcrR family transcriptional regulator